MNKAELERRLDALEDLVNKKYSMLLEYSDYVSSIRIIWLETITSIRVRAREEGATDEIKKIVEYIKSVI